MIISPFSSRWAAEQHTGRHGPAGVAKSPTSNLKVTGRERH